ncbi:hypothetical protein Q4578_12345 [Shimia thalassica]|uniref:hypothetical protein n=1 Tax=Shimia thalassica TaxID=1715693 RepID=UPI0026E1F8F1|nr:hypothetical protein [Shimia thalassica]MDO6522383.1 hypothetical protein [Shimia thalassica]
MRHGMIAGLAVFALVSCTEYSQMYKVGASTTQTNVDQAQCNTFAAQTVPPMIINDWIPIFDSRGRVVGHRVESYDANEGRRYSAVNSCMTERGYQRTTIPYCKPEDIKGKSFAPLSNSPAITPSICAVKQDGGGKILVDLTKPL